MGAAGTHASGTPEQGGKNDHGGQKTNPGRGQCVQGQERDMALPQGSRRRPRHGQTQDAAGQGEHEGGGAGTVRSETRRDGAYRPCVGREVTVSGRLRGTLAEGLPDARQTEHVPHPQGPAEGVQRGHRICAAQGAYLGACQALHARAGGAARPVHAEGSFREPEDAARRRGARGAHPRGPVPQGEASARGTEGGAHTRARPAEADDRIHGEDARGEARIRGNRRRPGNVGAAVRTRVRIRHEGRRTVRAHALRAGTQGRRARHIRATADPAVRAARGGGDTQVARRGAPAWHPVAHHPEDARRDTVRAHPGRPVGAVVGAHTPTGHRRP